MTRQRLRVVRRSSAIACPGVVSLVGAGPGDPDLLTWRAIQRLQAADVVLYDGLVPRPIVALAERAEQVSVARRAGPKSLTQGDVSKRMIDEAWRGRRVVRLKAGDPFVLGRGGEEIAALAQGRVPFEVVPGVSSALAAPALAGIPVTHRDVASGFLVVSGHAESAYVPMLERLAPDSVTVVVLMGGGERAGLRRALERAGWAPSTPAAIVTNASRPDQRVWIGTLAALDRREPVSHDEPGVIIVGRVVSLRATSPLEVPFVPEERSWQPLTIPRR